MGFEQKNWYMDGFEHENMVHGWVGQPDPKTSICIRPNTKYPPGWAVSKLAFSKIKYGYKKGKTKATTII